MNHVRLLNARFAKTIASFFYVGFVPIVPGTFGSLAAFLIYLPLVYFAQWQVYLGSIIFVIGIGVWAAGKVERECKIVDPSFVVIDEVAGQLITLFLIPFSWWNAAAGFLIFRGLDIIKPFPARQAERLPGGWGIMLDDVVAGVYGNLILQLFAFVWRTLLFA